MDNNQTTYLAGVVPDREAQLSDHGAVRLEPRGVAVLLVKAAGVVCVRPSDAHPALVIEHGQQTLLLPLDQIKAVLKNKIDHGRR